MFHLTVDHLQFTQPPVLGSIDLHVRIVYIWHGAAQLHISSKYKLGIEQQTADSGTLTAVFPVQFVVHTMI